MADQKMRIGIIGVGLYAGTALIPVLRETGRAEIVAIARRNPQRLAEVQQELHIPEAYTDWRQMLEKSALDAVMVATPPHAHAEPTLAALERGLHVFVEKPLAATYADAQRMAEASAKSDRIVMVGYNARGMAGWRTVKRKLSEGAIGRIRQVSATGCADARFMWRGAELAETVKREMSADAFFNDAFAPGNWRTNPTIPGGGMFADIGSHIQDLMLWLTDGSPVQVASFAQSTASPSIISALAHLDNGVLLSIAFNDNIPGGEHVFYGNGSMTFYGDKGLLTAEWSRLMTTDAEQIWIEQEGARSKVEPEFESIHPAAAFVATVLDGAPNICPLPTAARAVALTEAAYRSVAEGGIVQVDRLAVA